MKKTLAIVVPVALICLAGWSFANRRASEAAAKAKAASEKKPPPVTVQLIKPRPASINNLVTALGSLQSPFTVQLSPNVAGRIDYLEAREGDTVHKGEVLARIDPEQVEGQILQAQANLAQAQHSLAQAKITQTANTVGIYSTINQDQAAVASAQADYNEAVVTFDATVGAAHEAVVDAQSKVRAAAAQVQTATANVQLAEANLKDAQAKYTREYSLYTQGLVAPQDVDDTKAAYKVDVATVQANERTLRSSEAALESSRQEEQEAENQETITRKKGMSTIEDAKGVLTQAQATLKTAAANRSQIPAYQQNLNALYSQVVAAKGSLNQAIAQRAFLIVRSSIDGTVTQRLADPGAEASPGSQILVVQYLKWLYLTAYLPVEFADSVKPGAPGSVALDAFPGQAFNATVSDVNKSADQSSHQFMIRLKLFNPEGKFKPGMFAKVNLIGSITSAKIAVPVKAVTFATNGQASVTIVDSQNLAHIVSVAYGAVDQKHVEILSGITLNDRVVLDSDTPLTEDTLVKEGKVVHKKKGTGAPNTPAALGGGNGEGNNTTATTSGSTGAVGGPGGTLATPSNPNAPASPTSTTSGTPSGATTGTTAGASAATAGSAVPSATTSGSTNSPSSTGMPASGAAPTVSPANGPGVAGTNGPTVSPGTSSATGASGGTGANPAIPAPSVTTPSTGAATGGAAHAGGTAGAPATGAGTGGAAGGH